MHEHTMLRGQRYRATSDSWAPSRQEFDLSTTDRNRQTVHSTGIMWSHQHIIERDEISALPSIRMAADDYATVHSATAYHRTNLLDSCDHEYSFLNCQIDA